MRATGPYTRSVCQIVNSTSQNENPLQGSSLSSNGMPFGKGGKQGEGGGIADELALSLPLWRSCLVRLGSKDPRSSIPRVFCPGIHETRQSNFVVCWDSVCDCIRIASCATADLLECSSGSDSEPADAHEDQRVYLAARSLSQST
jgi:hypothetical protein